MQSDLIIDGYNLLHAAGLARARYGPGGLERARNQLLHLVRKGLAPERRSRTTIVFDGQNSDEVFNPAFQFHGMQVLFSAVTAEADDVIEELIRSHSAPRQLQIVSSDHRLQRAAQWRKATAIASDTFVHQLLQNQNNKSKTGLAGSAPLAEHAKLNELGEFDTHEWVEVFGAIDPAAIERELKHEQLQNQQKSSPAVTSGHPSASTSNRSRNDAAHQPPDGSTIPRKSTAKRPSASRFQSNQNLKEDDQTEFDKQPLPQESCFDLDFWEKRIAELDQEEY